MAQRKTKKPRTEAPTSLDSKNNERIKRPSNPFVIYRSQHCKNIEFQGMEASQISKILGGRWRALSPDERLMWDVLGEKVALQHAMKYPGYKYQPRRPGEKGSKNRPTRKGKGRQVVEEAAVGGKDNDEDYVPQPSRKATTSGSDAKPRGTNMVTPAAEAVSSPTSSTVATWAHDLVAVPVAPAAGAVSSSTSSTVHDLAAVTVAPATDATEIPETQDLTQAIEELSSTTLFAETSYRPFTFQCPFPSATPAYEAKNAVQPDMVGEEPIYPTLSLDEQHLQNQFVSSPTPLVNEFDTGVNVVIDPRTASPSFVNNFDSSQIERFNVVSNPLLHLPHPYGFEPVYGQSVVADYDSLSFNPYPVDVVDQTLTDLTNGDFNTNEPITYGEMLEIISNYA